jgi:hypothetical protein
MDKVKLFIIFKTIDNKNYLSPLPNMFWRDPRKLHLLHWRLPRKQKMSQL